MENKGLKSLTNLLSKTAGLVFFSFLAISLGVVFGLLFEGWVKDQPGTPVGSESSTLQTIDLPADSSLPKTTLDSSGKTDAVTEINAIKPSVIVRYKVRVGPYTNRNDALAASQQLQTIGYPVYVGNNPPYVVQVGAFSSQSNADHLQT